MSESTCSACRWFDSDHAEGQRWGTCKRNPPVAYAATWTNMNGDEMTESRTVRPEIHSTDFCGEFARRSPEAS